MVHEASGTIRPEITDLPAIGRALQAANLLENAMVQVGKPPAARWYQWRDGQWALIDPSAYR
jgi:hypothetical protein